MLKIHYKGTHNFSSFINISACDICLSILFAFLFNKTLKCFLKSNLDSASTRRPRQSDNWTSFVRLSWERFQVQVVSYFHLFTHVPLLDYHIQVTIMAVSERIHFLLWLSISTQPFIRSSRYVAVASWSTDLDGVIPNVVFTLQLHFASQQIRIYS